MGTPHLATVAVTQPPAPRREGLTHGAASRCTSGTSREDLVAPVGLSRACTHSAIFSSGAAVVLDIGDSVLSPSPVDSIVVTALILWLQHPQAPALSILDLAMQAYEGEDLEFSFEDELQPPHPFAELVRRAFAAHLNPNELFATIVDVERESLHLPARVEAAGMEWSVAIERFGERYGIWGPRRDRSS